MDIFCRDVIPFAPLTMQTIRFWLQIMKDHTVFIYMGLPCEQCELREEAEQFYFVFCDLEKRSCAVKCGDELSRFVEVVIVAVRNIFVFKRHIVHLLSDCKICGGCLYPLFMDHLSREAAYFLKLLHKLCRGEMKYPIDAILNETVFWLRIMTDHLKFIRGLLDPSERQLVEQVKALSEQFDQLGLRARDFGSMLWHYQPTDDLVVFVKNVTEAVILLRDFLAQDEELIGECAALSVIAPLMADHDRRETDHFLDILDIIRQALMNYDETLIGCTDEDD